MQSLGMREQQQSELKLQLLQQSCSYQLMPWQQLMHGLSLVGAPKELELLHLVPKYQHRLHQVCIPSIDAHMLDVVPMLKLRCCM
jgi:hypothetical protein